MRRRLVLGVGLAGLVASAALGAEFRQLNGREIVARLTGMAFSDDVHWTYLFGHDGRLRSTALGRDRVGTWWVEGDAVCASNGPGIAPCHEVWVSGDAVELRRDDAPPEEGRLEQPSREP